MAPSSGHSLVPKVWKIVKFAVDKTSSAVRSKFPQSSTTSTSNVVLQPIRISSQADPLHPLSRVRQSRQSQYRWFSTTAGNLRDQASQAKGYDRSSFDVARVAKGVRQRGAVPFASTLRPNLTGGALPRTAGGYCLGGTGRGVRHFSQTPSCQAQVIQNVNAGIRAFFLGGGKARFDGVDPFTGEKRFRRVTKTEDEVLNAFEKHMSGDVRGTTLEFQLSPTITALIPSTSQTLGSVNVLDALSVDFARALKDLSLTLSDLRRLSALGDLPLELTTTSKGPTLSVRFVGCDGDTVARLCEELGVFRGIVREDERWDEEKDVEMALLFPFAPTSRSGSEYFEPLVPVDTEIAAEQVEWQAMMSPSVGIHTPGSTASYEHIHGPAMTPAYDSASSSGYESMRESELADGDPYMHYHAPSHRHQTASRASAGTNHQSQSHNFEGLEGIYRFLRECDDARGKAY
ncbi:MAG: hypothetical protein Q9195_002964 [Heterodermia aff. obscurata]